MLVVGATYTDETRAIRKLVGDMTFLVPGIGAQGGNVKDTVAAGLNSQKKGMIINSSRGIIFSDDLEVERVGVSIKELKRALKFPDEVEFKFNKSSRKTRESFLI